MTDTAAKRASALNVGLPWRPPLGIYLDGSITDQDRASAAYLYRGIDFAGDGDDEGGAPPAAATDWLIIARYRGSR